VTVLLLTTLTICPNVSLFMPDKCQVDLTVECALDLLKQIQNRTSQELPEETVESYLNQVMNMTSHVENNCKDQNSLLSYGNGVLDVTENLVSALVWERGTKESISISLQSLDVQVIMIGQSISMEKKFSLNTSTASVDIELTGISNRTNVSVAFMSYTNMAALLNPSFFNTSINMGKTMVSAVVTTTLLQAADINFTSVSFNFNHDFQIDSDLFCMNSPSCVHWKKNKWEEDGCNITKTNSTHTLCSCDHQGTFAVIMQTYPVQMSRLDIFTIVVFAVGMIFLSLSALTLAFCHPNTKAAKIPLINLCISLLLAMPYYLFIWLYPCPGKQLSIILYGILLFLYLSAGMWMLIEAVLLFTFVKNLSKVRSNLGKWLSLKWLIIVGYMLPLVLATVCTVLRYTENVPPNMTFVYYAPFHLIFSSNLALFIIIITMLIFTLIHLKNGNLQRSNTNDKKLKISIMIKSMAQFFILCGPCISLYTPIFDMTAYYVFVFFSLQQGIFIFLVHCLLNQE
ncbi:adhesion G protein-coupled receptor E3-like, partial [Clarias magur]